MNHENGTRLADPFVRLARQSIRAYVAEGVTLSPPEELPEEMTRPAAVFVSIKKAGALRGCIGTILPTAPNAAVETIANAIKAATADPRFPAIRRDELEELDVSVDVLTPPEICGPEDLDPSRYGVIVESGWRRGLLLPALEGVESVEDQIAIARRKAGIAADESVILQRFSVNRHV